MNNNSESDTSSNASTRTVTPENPSTWNKANMNRNSASSKDVSGFASDNHDGTSDIPMERSHAGSSVVDDFNFSETASLASTSFSSDSFFKHKTV